MTGYSYSESEPTEECGLCSGTAYAEFCDVGVGMVQMAPYHCGDCGAELSPLGPDGKHLDGWVPARPASERGERVTGYYITHQGSAIEMTFDQGHREFNERTRTSTSSRLARGWVRITNLEGFAIDLPSAMTGKTRRTLARLLKEIAEADQWGTAYVFAGSGHPGGEMTRLEIMTLVSSLPLTASDAAPPIGDAVDPDEVSALLARSPTC
jgi:hypothetical protein